MTGIEWGNMLIHILLYCTIIFCTHIVADSFVRMVYALVPTDCVDCDECKKQIEALSRTVDSLERLTCDLVRAEVLRTGKARGGENEQG